jgi:bacterioferritin (cytochrome b1)
MSFDIEITTEALKSYARTDDAVEAFNMTVANGQTRLSLQVLVDIVNTLVEKIDSLQKQLKDITSNNNFTI